MLESDGVVWPNHAGVVITIVDANGKTRQENWEYGGLEDDWTTRIGLQVNRDVSPIECTGSRQLFGPIVFLVDEVKYTHFKAMADDYYHRPKRNCTGWVYRLWNYLGIPMNYECMAFKEYWGKKTTIAERISGIKL